MSARKSGQRPGGGDELGGTPAETLRGETWPCLRQFAVFMENRVGRLHDLMRLFEGRDVAVRGLSIANSVDCALVRLIVSATDRAREILQLSQFHFSENDVVGVELPDGPQPFVQICIGLLQAELNIHYVYPLLYRRNDHGAVALYVDDVDSAMQTLRAKGLRLITENDLLESEDF